MIFLKFIMNSQNNTQTDLQFQSKKMIHKVFFLNEIHVAKSTSFGIQNWSLIRKRFKEQHGIFSDDNNHITLLKLTHIFIRLIDQQQQRTIIILLNFDQPSNSINHYFQFSLKINMSQRAITKQQEIEIMMKEKVVDLNQIIQKQGFFTNFIKLASNNFIKLTKNIFGDFQYQRKNKFSVEYKLKILDYLKEKSMLLNYTLAEQNKKNYYNYDVDFFTKKPKDLNAMKDMLLQGKSQVQAAEGSLERLKSSRDFLRAQFLNEGAYEFDRQRYCSIFWGILTGSLINSTIYKKGRTARKAAVLVTIAHIFGQVSYHLNLDKYFDSVYEIFEQQAEAFMVAQSKRQKASDKVWIKNQIES